MTGWSQRRHIAGLISEIHDHEQPMNSDSAAVCSHAARAIRRT
jgi:hypothetical protein